MAFVMDERVGRAAIDYAAANARARGKKTLDVGFHGGGEQTLAFELLVALTAYAREVATRNGLGLRATLGTNGCFSEARAEWLAGNFSEVCISFDGPPRIQDYARPLRNGGPSSPLVRRTVRVFDRAKLLYSFQATVTRDTVGEMPAIVRYFARHTHPFMVKFEPVSDCGRFYGRGDQIPPGGEFARSFNEAYEVARRLRVDLAFSGIRLWGAGHSCFCGAFCEPFAVTPDARVSACYEAYSADAPYADRFLFGCYDADRGTFSFDMAKLKALRQRNVYGLQPCARCFCKYSCAGDCPTRNFRASKTTDLRIVGARCEAIREITRYRLARYVDTQERKPAIPCVGGDL